jgi:hypothetical protein
MYISHEKLILCTSPDAIPTAEQRIRDNLFGRRRCEMCDFAVGCVVLLPEGGNKQERLLLKYNFSENSCDRRSQSLIMLLLQISLQFNPCELR